MNDQLDRTVRAVLADIVATAPPAEAHPVRQLATEADATNRRPLFAIAAAVVAVAALGTGLYLFSRQGDGAPPAHSTPLAPTQLDQLLYPAGMHVSQVLSFTDGGSGDRAVLLTPEGRPFVVNVAEAESQDGSLPATADQRRINGSTFAASIEGGSVNYATSTSCLVVTIGERLPQEAAWSADALAVLDDLVVEGNHVSLQVPAGWTSMGGIGRIDTGFVVSFTTADGRTAEMAQTLVGPAGALVGLLGSAIVTSTTVNGHAAWAYTVDGWTFLAWTRGDGSAKLGLKGGTAGELVALAEGMTIQHGRDWAEGLAAGSDGSPASLVLPTFTPAPGSPVSSDPTRATGPVAATPPSTPATCGVRTVSLRYTP